MIIPKDIVVSLDQLFLDPNNYRLADERDERTVSDSQAEELQSDILKSLDKQRLGELKDSILNNGFLEMERIVVRSLRSEDEKEDDGNEDENQKEKLEETLSKQKGNQVNDREKKYIVVEGNRRTAALKSLKESNIKLDERLRKKFNSLNVILIDGDEKELKSYTATIMGIRHVSGPKKWDGFQSSKLINDLYLEGKSFTEIGDILGITNREAGRRFRGYKAFSQMRSSDDYGQKVEPRHYGLLLEFLASAKEGKPWLEWDDEKYLFKNERNLERVYGAITSNSDGHLEIKNPTDARKFVGLLATEYREEIERGVDISTMPNPSEVGNHAGNIKRIQKFIDFVEKTDFVQEEYECLDALLALLNDKQDENNG